MRKGIRFSLFMGLFAILLLSGCGGKTVVESDLRIKGAPDWVNEGSQALNDKGGRLFHGVGEAGPMGDASLQTSVADERARAAVARILSSYMDVVSQDYSSATGAGEDRLNQQAVSRQISSFTKMNLSGARIIARWKDKRTGIIYSLAGLDMKHLKETLRAADDMNGDLKRYIDRQGENIFDNMVRTQQ